MKCPIASCGIVITSREQYLEHMPTHMREGITFSCIYPKCSTPVRTLQSFRSHVSLSHPRKKMEPQVEIEEEPASSECEASSSHQGRQSSSPSFLNHNQESLSSRVPQDNSNQAQGSQPENTTTANESDNQENLFPEYAAKDQLAKFYLKLEAVHFLPSSTVQIIANQIKLVTEMSHLFLKKSLKSELQKTGFDPNTVTELIDNTFRADPIYNIHHKAHDSEQLGTEHLRMKFWKEHYPFVEPKEIYLGRDENGKKKFAHHVSIRESIEVMLRDPKVKQMVRDSFQRKPCSDVLADITDGSAYTEHMKQHSNGKCIFINLFQDGFDYSAFGPSQGVYKPIGFYFSLGNLKPEYRTKLDLIQMVYMILEKHLRPSQREELDDVDKLKEAVLPLVSELEDLKINGILFDGENIPVCLLFGQGDNAGQHIFGGFVGSFSCQHCCRFCPISLNEFRAKPTLTKPFRSPEEYDSAVQVAKTLWHAERDKCLESIQRKKERAQHQNLLDRVRAPGTRNTVKNLLSKSAFTKLRGIHYQGVKYRPSPLNSEKLGFHVCQGPSLSVCCAHDLLEGIGKNMIPIILKHCIDKGWFDFATLNRRIRNFPYEGSDSADTPTPLKTLKALGGNACENWTLIRLLPLLIGDLIVDKEDEMWQLYLKFKGIVEFVFAPKITVSQVLYLRSIINEFLTSVQQLLPQCLWPKAHLLSHYPDLILVFGPLIRLFTLRFESKHVFFKNVAKACRNHINFTYTLARKYMCRFAYNNSSNLIQEDVIYQPNHSSPVIQSSISEERRSVIPTEFLSDDLLTELTQVSGKGITYRVGDYMVLDSPNQCDLEVGLIDMIFLKKSTDDIYLLMAVKPAENTFQGVFKIIMPATSYRFSSLESLPDYYPLPSYLVGGQNFISLKHSMIKM
ncbi:hypothetical protein FOCC_FOCC008372 [Frankliniella occidentalis]|nr:hypothetical protein FOCC_FOCC008372 [Frankliniella occidentalis]